MTLPIGSIVDFQDAESHQQARLIVVQHSPSRDGMLYMLAEKPISPPSEAFKLYSFEYLVYRLHAGWFVGNVSARSIYDTGERCKVQPYLETPEGDMTRYADWPGNVRKVPA